MKLIHSLIFFCILGLAVNAIAAPKNTTIMRPSSQIQKLAHLDAVGAVFSIEGKKASIGTGTYIGNKRILTAGHLFKNYLPKSVNKESGPVKIDISDKNVFWTNDPSLNLRNPPSVYYHAVSITVDAKFINEFNSTLESPDKDDVKSDFAILTLSEQVMNIDAISIPELYMPVPAEGLLIGYGKDSKPGHRRKIAAQALQGLTDMGEWGIILSNLISHMQNNPLLTSPIENKELETLMGRDPLSKEDTRIKRATQGDSGGPLLIATKDKKIHVLGVMSANSKAFNAFASLVIKTPEGYFRSPKFDALLEASN